MESGRNGIITGYVVVCSDASGSVVADNSTTGMTITVTALEPHTMYSCSVAALNVDGEGPPAAQSYTTSESGEQWGKIGNREMWPFQHFPSCMCI